MTLTAKTSIWENEQLSQALIETLPIAIYTCNTEGYITYFNNAAAELWGRQPVLGKDLWCGSWKIWQADGVTPVRIDESPMAIALKEGRKIIGEEIIVERPDGDRKHIIPHPQFTYDSEGNITGAINMLMDVTERKAAEEQRAKLAAIVQSSEDAIISKTLTGVITSWNDAAERLFGYTAEEMIGQPVLKLIPPELAEEEPQILDRLKRGERVEHFETKRVTKDGKILELSLTISPIKDSTGRIIGASKIGRDITELKKMEQRKDDFIKMASHELKTPITSIKGYVQLLMTIYDEVNETKLQSATTTVRTSLYTISKQVSKLTRLVSELLDLTRIESGKLELYKTEFDLGEMVEETVQEARLTTSRHALILQNDYEGTVYADKDRISQVLLNLLTNAIKYSPDGEQIEVLITGNASAVSISIKDYGIGIDKKDHLRIFERFYRVEGKSEQTYPGFGIGLFIANDIVQRHNGSLAVKSEKTKGSVFTFTLPNISKANLA